MTHGEKNDTSPASTATGTASSIDPENAVSRSQSAIALPVLGGHLLDHVDQGLTGWQLAADQCREPTLPVEHHRARRLTRVVRRREAQERLAPRVVDRRPGHPEGALEGDGGVLAAVPDV